MKVLITGGAGFVGSQLSSRFLQEGHTVVGIGLSSLPGAGFPASAKYVSGDTTRPGECQQEVRVRYQQGSTGLPFRFPGQNRWGIKGIRNASLR